MCLFLISNNPWCVWNIFHYWHIKTCMDNGASWYDYSLFVFVLFTMPIFLFCYTSDIFRYDYHLNRIAYLSIRCCFFLQFKGVQDLLHNVVSHYFVIDGTVFTCLHQWFHVVTDSIKYNLWISSKSSRNVVLFVNLLMFQLLMEPNIINYVQSTTGWYRVC